MRVFIAIELSEDVKEYLSSIQETAKKHSCGGKFSAKENLHLTVRFIGVASEEMLKRIQKAILEAVKELKPFELQTAGLGVFQRKNKVILWTGVKGNADKLQELYNVMEEHLGLNGFPKEEKDYNPHLTLGREILLNSALGEIERELKLEDRAIIVNKLSLMESCRVNGRLVYRPIFVANFSK